MGIYRMKVSICMTLKDRAELLRWGLESIAKQDYDHRKIEICILDGGSKDKLFNLIDRFSDQFVFKYAVEDRNKSYLPIVSNAPAASLNCLIKHMASYDCIIKTDPEIIFKDEWIISEIVDCVNSNPKKMYNARTHFTREDGWFTSYSDIVREYEKHYLFAEGGPFSRSKFYFLSGFSKKNFIELGGIEELFGYGVGYEDNCFREMWKNQFGSYEEEITGNAIHLWHGPNKSRPAWEVANGRMFEHLKKSARANVWRLNGKGDVEVLDEPQWANPEMLSKIYTIKGGQVTMVDDVNDGKSVELDLPF
jgi:glycosyltransferase involved in cell wall biosynthesis